MIKVSPDVTLEAAAWRGGCTPPDFTSFLCIWNIIDVCFVLSSIIHDACVRFLQQKNIELRLTAPSHWSQRESFKYHDKSQLAAKCVHIYPHWRQIVTHVETKCRKICEHFRTPARCLELQVEHLELISCPALCDFDLPLCSGHSPSSIMTVITGSEVIVEPWAWFPGRFPADFKMLLKYRMCCDVPGSPEQLQRGRVEVSAE